MPSPFIYYYNKSETSAKEKLIPVFYKADKLISDS